LANKVGRLTSPLGLHVVNLEYLTVVMMRWWRIFVCDVMRLLSILRVVSSY